ncbi:DivIVA domain-containing protein [Pseudokineococcus lusitanus]|uniref:Cell wall synthesis protein Wag31 n=1 Tax=Pseudokineococcus lusitanus TaxID=763993 RepID=A0A3N1HKU4_9ACTN|nr:DivIVA domain-containing protein [Pseudokineococcus lusitanus]ROP43079.1 DivIVA domain-containing protein [Pseudokineococcus lusitanus]
MALTPEMVASKTFTASRIRDGGYNVNEVDDFLDEVVTELTRLRTENDGLREQLAEAERRAADGGQPAAATGDAATTEDATPAAPPAPEAPAVETPAVPEPPAPVEAPAAPAAALADGTGTSAGSAAGVLALAQRLHDEHVRAGEEERDRLVTGARTEADRLVTEAEDTRRTTLEQLEEQRATELGALERERSLLERKIDELRGFERDYRSRLRAYLEGQLRDLDGTAAVVPGGGSGGTGGSS